MARKPKAKVDIDVVPYLSIMVIVLKLITLILIVMVMPIALNPDLLRVLSYEQLFRGTHEHDAEKKKVKEPVYFDCRQDGVEIIPSHRIVTLAELTSDANPIAKALDKVQENRETAYVILMIRPRSLPLYRHVRKMVTARGNIDVGYDVVDAELKIDWAAQAKKARISNLEL